MKVLSKFILALLIVGLILPAPLWATTYFVAPTGSNSNPGTTVGLPFLTIQKGVNSALPGDTVTVADGTYATFSTGGAGTSIAPITVQSTNPLGANVVAPSVTAVTNLGINVSASWYIIDGFEITGGNGAGGGAPADVSNVGIAVYGVSGTILRNNKIHGIGRLVCSNSQYGFGGIYTENVGSITIDSNLIYSIGRLMNGESGCSTTLHGNDHGIYIHGGSNLTVQRNVIYDSNRGWAIQAAGVGGDTITNLNILNNTIADHNFNGFNAGQIILSGVQNTVNITNNIFWDPLPGFGAVDVADASPTLTSASIDYNLTSVGSINYGTRPGLTIGGHNIVSTTPGFTNVGARDYTLAPGSAAIDTGFNVGFPFNGLGPDMGYKKTGAAGPPPQPFNFGPRLGRSGVR